MTSRTTRYDSNFGSSPSLFHVARCCAWQSALAFFRGLRGRWQIYSSFFHFRPPALGFMFLSSCLILKSKNEKKNAKRKTHNSTNLLRRTQWQAWRKLIFLQRGHFFSRFFSYSDSILSFIFFPLPFLTAPTTLGPSNWHECQPKAHADGHENPISGKSAHVIHE